MAQVDVGFYPAICTAGGEYLRLEGNRALIMDAKSDALRETVIRHLRGETWDASWSLVVVRVEDEQIVLTFEDGFWNLT